MSLKVVLGTPATIIGGGVESVTGDGVTGTPEEVVISYPNADEIDDSTTTNKFSTGVNTGDQDLSGLAEKATLTQNGGNVTGSINTSTNTFTLNAVGGSVDGEIEPGNTGAVEGGKIYDINEIVTNENLANPIFIIDNTYVNASGVLQTISGFKTIKISVVSGQIISYGNFTIDVEGYSSWYLGDTPVSVAERHTNSLLPIENITVPIGVDTMYISIARSSNVPSDYADTMVNIGVELLPYIESLIYTKSSVGFNFLAAKLSEDNYTPDPTTANNAVNKDYFETNGLTTADLTTVKSVNLAKITSEFVLEDTYVNASGELQTITDFKTLKIDVVAGEVVSFGNFSIDTLGHASWYTNSTPSGLISSYTTASLPLENLTVPAGVNILYVAVARSTNVDTDWDKIMCNVGATLLPYVDPTDSVVAIKEYKIAGGDSDNAAQLGGDVYFSSVFTSALQLDLPSGATEPAGLNVFDAWVDTNDSTVKIKLV